MQAYKAGDRIYVQGLGLGTVIDPCPDFMEEDLAQIQLDHTPRQGRHAWLNPTFLPLHDLAPAPPASMQLLVGETGQEYCRCSCHINVFLRHLDECCAVCPHCHRRMKIAFHEQHVTQCHDYRMGGAALTASLGWRQKAAESGSGGSAARD